MPIHTFGGNRIEWLSKIDFDIVTFFGFQILENCRYRTVSYALLVPIKLGKGLTSSIEESVANVNTRPSVSRMTGPSASLIRAQPIPPRTAINGTPPSLTDSLRSLPNRSALSRAVPPLLVPLHSSI